MGNEMCQCNEQRNGEISSELIEGPQKILQIIPESSQSLLSNAEKKIVQSFQVVQKLVEEINESPVFSYTKNKISIG